MPEKSVAGACRTLVSQLLEDFPVIKPDRNIPRNKEQDKWRKKGQNNTPSHLIKEHD